VLELVAALLAVTGLGAAALFLTWGFMNNRFLDDLNRRIARQASTPQEQVLATFDLVSEWQYLDVERLGSPLARWMARVEHASPFHVSARTALAGGVDHSGPCGSLTRSMVVLLRRAGFDARKTILYSEPGEPQHTVAEVRLDGAWRVFDPTYRWYWIRPQDGEIATVEDLQDKQLLATIQSQHPHYPLEKYHYGHVQHVRWEKVPGLPMLRALLRPWVGEARLRQIETPWAYERPPFLLGGTSFVVGILGLGLWLTLRRRSRREKRRA
jgi:hypothetical protein